MSEITKFPKFEHLEVKGREEYALLNAVVKAKKKSTLTPYDFLESRRLLSSSPH